MRLDAELTQKLQGIRRGYKLAILMPAAWAPFLLADRPIAAALVMGSMAALFFLVTGRPRGSDTTVSPVKVDAPS